MPIRSGKIAIVTGNNSGITGDAAGKAGVIGSTQFLVAMFGTCGSRIGRSSHNSRRPPEPDRPDVLAPVEPGLTIWPIFSDQYGVKDINSLRTGDISGIAWWTARAFWLVPAWTFPILAIVLLFCSIALAQSSEDDDAIGALFDRYWTLFSDNQPHLIAAEIYRPPVLIPTEGDMVLLQTEAAIAGFFERALSDLVRDGYARSELRTLDTCLLSPTKAITSVRFVRYLTDGRVMGSPLRAATYVLHKREDDWRIAMAFSNDRAQTVSCRR